MVFKHAAAEFLASSFSREQAEKQAGFFIGKQIERERMVLNVGPLHYELKDGHHRFHREIEVGER